MGDGTGVNVSALDAPRVAAHGQEITVTANVTNTGDSEVDADVSYEADGTTDAAGTTTQTITLGAGETQEVSFTLNTEDLPGSDAGTTNEYTHGITASTSDDTDTQTADLTVGTDSNGEINIEVIDQQSNAVAPPTNVALYRAGDWGGSVDATTTAPIRVDETDSQGFAQFSDLAVGPSETGTPGSQDYVAVAGYDDENFTSRSTQLSLFDPDQRTDSRTLRLERVISPGELNVEVIRGEATANGQDQVQYEVTVLGDLNGEPYEGATVNVADDGTDLTYEDGDQTETTDENGTARFNISSDTVQTVEFTFSEPTENLEETASGSFIPQSGEGNLYGSVVGQDTTEGIEGGSVWLVRSSDYNTNSVTTTIDLDNIDQNGDTDDDTVFIRLNDSEGGVISPDEYDIRVANTEADSGDSDAVTLVDQLNETDAAVGGGYALIDQDNDGLITFKHTRLAPENYYAQVSYDAANASDFDGDVDDTLALDEENEAFVNVTGAGPVTDADLGTGTAVEFSPSANLTLEQAVEDSESSGANLADTEGFTNSFGVPTEGTNEDGDYVLSEIPTNYQSGIQYVAIADAPSYSTDFADVELQEDGQLTFSETQGSNDFYLEPVPVQPDGVDITQVGTKENSTAETVEFDNSSDPFYQEVPRDGQTIDVFNVNTTAEGELVNATTTVTFDSEVVDGEFVNIAGGDYVSIDNENNTATLYTGSDGQAQVWYQSDQGAETINTQKRAVLDADTSVEDTSNVTFVGVKNFGSASISGIVTDSEDTPLPNSAVWTEEIILGTDDFDDRIVITPNTSATPGTPAYGDAVDEDSDEFDVLLLTYNATSNDFDTVNKNTTTAGDLRSYDFSAFPSLNANGEYKLYQRANQDTQGEASYTFDPVPALETGGIVDATTRYRVGAVQYGDFQKGSVSNDALPSVQPNTTATANVVIPIVADPAELQISGVTDQTISEGENTTVTATIQNTGGNFQADQQVDLVVDGTVVANTTISVASGENATVTLVGDTSDLAAGEYDLTVSTADDSQSATLTVSAESTPPTNVDRFDTDNDGTIEFQEVIAAIQASNDGSQIGGQPVGFQDVLAVIEAFNQN
ncbi:Ig-like domain-containing protein [Haloarcula sp. GH36]|uniref:Ig-like domain-containing protein n=1 Tax=Haloarcula montana TaxID=3111776 RepID=UPI002D7715AB|nr:Ig-like domain-containing protein [Haloarcula sp. GH36]